MTVVDHGGAPILDQLRGQYEKLLRLVIRKYVPAGAIITIADLAAMLVETQDADPLVLFVHGHRDSIEFKVIRASAARLIADHQARQTQQEKPS